MLGFVFHTDGFDASFETSVFSLPKLTGKLQSYQKTLRNSLKKFNFPLKSLINTTILFTNAVMKNFSLLLTIHLNCSNFAISIVQVSRKFIERKIRAFQKSSGKHIWVWNFRAMHVVFFNLFSAILPFRFELSIPFENNLLF